MRYAALSLSLLLLVLLCGFASGAVTVYGGPNLDKLSPLETPGAAWRPGAVALECARNESEACQVLVRDPAAPLADVALLVGDLRGPGGAVLPASQVRVYREEWVDINAPYEVDKPSTNPDWRPDPLVPVRPGERCNVAAGRNLIFWLAIAVPESARPGRYEGEVRLTAGGRALPSVKVQLRVRDFALPRRPLLQSMVGLAAANLYKAHGCKTPADQEALIRLYFDEYARARLSPFLYAPGTQAFNPLPDAAIQWAFVKGADGQPTGEVRLDLAGFDREGKRYLDERDAFSAFNFAPYLWVRRDKQLFLRIADRNGTAVERRNADGSLNPVFDQLVINVFRGIGAHLAERGWLDRAVYYVVDEPGDNDAPALKEICQLVRQADPRLRTALTYDPANRPRLKELVDDQGRSLVSVWVPYCTHYNAEVAADQRRKGADYWLYDVSTTCLIGDSAATNRGLFWTIWERGAHGYLYYLTTWWGRQATPWERPSFMLPEFTYRYRQGDGYFFYPPLRRGEPEQPILDYVVPTIRWEMLREGAEDYDTLALLQSLTEQAEQKKLKVAAEGRQALALARELAETVGGVAEGHGIRDLTFTATAGWSFGLEEGWLTHKGGARSDLPLSFKTSQPDGQYQLALSVYDDSDYRGKPYSRFLVNGQPYASPGSGLKGSVVVPCGTVTVKDGRCSFVLSSVADNFGVIVYQASLSALPGAGGRDLYAVRTKLAETIERLQTGLR